LLRVPIFASIPIISYRSEYSEMFGRRSIHIVSFAFLMIFAAIAAVSVNMGMFIVFRLLVGGAAASVQSVSSGVIADMWEPKEGGKAMGIFMQGPLCGPGPASIIGGALTQAFGWRSIQWFLTGFGGLVLALVLSCLPETVGRKTVRNEDGGP
jgi:MFS family permease